jgi:hypothetical protein
MCGMMRLRVAVMMKMMSDGRFMVGLRQSHSLYNPRMVRDPTHRLRERQRPLYWQEAAEQKNHQMANARVHEGKLTQ